MTRFDHLDWLSWLALAPTANLLGGLLLVTLPRCAQLAATEGRNGTTKSDVSAK